MPRQKRHDFYNRQAPKWQDGYFVPSHPDLIKKHPKDWDWIDTLAALKTMVRNPVEASTEVTRTTPVVQVKSLGHHMTVLHDPEAIRHCFVENHENYRLHPTRQNVLEPILKQGLLTTEGEKWKHSRRVIAPMFVPRQVKKFSPAMQATTQRALSDLFNETGTFHFSDKMLTLAYFVLSETLFSGDIDEVGQDTLRDVGSFMESLGKADPLDILMAPRWIPRLTKLSGQASVKRLRRTVRELITQRREQIETDKTAPEDFLTLLLTAGRDDNEALSETEIEDQIMTFIGAGHETTSRALTWMFYLLSQDTKARTRLEAEIDALDMSQPADLWEQSMPWSMACFEEAMRLYPPAAIISRQAIAPDTIGDIIIPKDGAVLINQWTLHRHELLWERPNSFDPERFLPENRQNIDRMQYIPFGLGHRVCIGQRFAMQEAAILIALIAKSFRFDYAGETPPWPLMRITLQADNGMPMTVTKR